MVVVSVVLGSSSASEWYRRSATLVAVTVPQLSPEAQAGREVFDRSCAACHGPNAARTAAGPPLVHRIYASGHHADVTFMLAARRGVRAHHWRFGDMPPQRSLNEEEADVVVRYVRELQRANGID